MCAVIMLIIISYILRFTFENKPVSKLHEICNQPIRKGNDFEKTSFQGCIYHIYSSISQTRV